MKKKNYYWKRILKIMPKLIREYWHWFICDLKHSSSAVHDNKFRRVDLLIKSHVIEKGICMPNRRYEFALDRVRILINKCNNVIALDSDKSIELQSTLNDLEHYLAIHEAGKHPLPEDVKDGIVKLLEHKKQSTESCHTVNKDDYFRPTIDFKEFAYSRHSCRNFSSEPIDISILENAITLAQTAPSACNRQSVNVYIISTEEKKAEVLKIQRGNRGFGHLADKLLLITSDNRCWNYKERNYAFLDGGIFTMNLLYALHYYHICACTLNAELSSSQIKQLRNIVGLQEFDIPIVFIAIGHAQENFMLPGAQRLPVEEIYKIV